MRYIAIILSIFPKVVKKILIYFYKFRFKKFGKVYFNPFDSFSYQNIELGSDVFIGSGAIFSADNVLIKIGNKVMFGPNVSILAGDHNYENAGVYMKDVKDKKPYNDLGVIIEDDVWVGANTTILKGVHIKKGAIIAAGSIVSNDVEECIIVAGVPAKKIKDRFANKNIKEKHLDFLMKKHL